MVSRKDLIKYDLFINDFYDEWTNYRDGLRDWYNDFKMIKKVNYDKSLIYPETFSKRLRMNKKQEKLLLRRKLRKYKWRMS